MPAFIGLILSLDNKDAKFALRTSPFFAATVSLFTKMLPTLIRVAILNSLFHPQAEYDKRG